VPHPEPQAKGGKHIAYPKQPSSCFGLMTGRNASRVALALVAPPSLAVVDAAILPASPLLTTDNAPTQVEQAIRPAFQPPSNARL
jgi:hypothetical protein